MRLVRFSVQRFRSITETERFQLGDLTVLVGPNNEGKSNILQALVTSLSSLAGAPSRGRRVVRRVRGQRLQWRYDWSRDFPLALQQTDPSGTTIFNLDFELAPEEIKDFETAVGSRLNGILPVGLSFGPDGRYSFSVRKQRHSKALSAKKEEIEDFIAERIHHRYVPAARTKDATLDVVDDMIEREFRLVEQTPEFQEATEALRQLEEPIVQRLEKSICESLQRILPAVRGVTLGLEESALRRSRRSKVLVDDGALTDLEFKGDGMQSLAALSLIRHYSEEGAAGRQLILLVEEPEAHLHPGAIHEIGAVLRDTAERQQIVISTHSPLLVNRFDLSSNLIVRETKARSARSVVELRDVLGVRTSDNLENADVVLVLEGSEDERALRPILSNRSSRLRHALGTGALAIEPLFGGAKLAYVLMRLNNSMCRVQTFLDWDAEGKAAAERARQEGLLAPADEMYARFPGAAESELEDLFNVGEYAESLTATLGVVMDGFSAIQRNRGKWSARMKLMFENQGRRWDDEIAAQAKSLVALAVSQTPASAVDPRADGVVAALVSSLESRLSP